MCGDEMRKLAEDLKWARSYLEQQMTMLQNLASPRSGVTHHTLRRSTGNLVTSSQECWGYKKMENNWNLRSKFPADLVERKQYKIHPKRQLLMNYTPRR
jgi:hypothetical protein